MISRMVKPIERSSWMILNMVRKRHNLVSADIMPTPVIVPEEVVAVAVEEASQGADRGQSASRGM